jgi:hypothetical protein
MGSIIGATKNFLTTLVGAREESPQQPKSNYVFGEPTPHRHYLLEDRYENIDPLTQKRYGTWLDWSD